MYALFWEVNCVDGVVYATGLTEEDMSKAQVGISRHFPTSNVGLTLVCKFDSVVEC